MERKTGLRLLMSYSAESPHEIKMPGCSSELSIRNHMIAERFNLSNELGNALILHFL